MDFLNWTFIIVGIWLALIGIHIEIFQKRGQSRSRLIKRAFAWGSIESVIIYILGLILWVEAKDDASTRQILVNTELVLDCSVAMAEQFGERTKIDAAKGIIQNILSTEVSQGDNLAFRKFGGSCRDKNSWLMVKFDTNNEKKVLKALQNITIDGKTTLVDAIIEATGDFNNIKQFQNS